MSDPKKVTGRRRFLAAAGLGTLAIGAPLSVRRLRETEPSGHVPGAPDPSPFSPEVLNTLLAFLDAYFGADMDELDRRDLTWRLVYAVENDGGWRQPYADFAMVLDAAAQDLGPEEFADAPRRDQQVIIQALLDGKRRTRTERRIRSFFSDHAARLDAARRVTVPHLLRLYRHAAAPWRRRGLASWPGAAGDPRAYTRPPGPNRC